LSSPQLGRAIAARADFVAAMDHTVVAACRGQRDHR
jgi:hypothetical protein